MGDIGYFTLPRGKLHHLGKPLHEETVAEARAIQKLHVVSSITERSCYESLLLCVASQSSGFEIPVKFIHSMRNDPLEALRDIDYIEQKASNAGVLYWNRFQEPIAFAESYPGGIEQLATNLLAEPHTTRTAVVRDEKAKYLAMKTVSFWHLTLGGTQLLTIDRHNARELASIGVDVNCTHYSGRRRNKGVTKGRTIVTTPSRNEYTRLEAEATALLAGETLLQDERGELDLGLVTTLFWTAGAKRARDIDPAQLSFTDALQLGFSCPYSSPVSAYARSDELPESFAKELDARKEMVFHF